MQSSMHRKHETYVLGMMIIDPGGNDDMLGHTEREGIRPPYSFFERKMFVGDK